MKTDDLRIVKTRPLLAPAILSEEIPLTETASTRVYEARRAIEAILDEAMVCHVGFVVDGQPYVIPTIHARDGARLYIHGSPMSRMLRTAATGEPLLASDLRRLIEKYSLPFGMFEEIIAGVEMDLTIPRYRTFEELRVYCYRVASAVGLVSIEIFGYRNPRCKEYAIELGLALQLTNIIRDVGKDLQNGRIYLPQEDLARFNYSETELQDRQYNERFLHLMEFEALRARQLFARATAALPSEDRRAMAPAEIMASIYRGLLRQMELDKFRVLEKEYRLSNLEKAGRIATQLLKSFFYLPPRTSV